MNNDITAVVGVVSKLPLFLNFYSMFRKVHPDVPMVIGALQAEQEVVDYLRTLCDSNLKVVFGEPVDKHHVSFSENYNAAINAVETDKLVLIHTDMYLSENFFKELSVAIDEKGNFQLYQTMEPPVYVGHRRPGKILGNFGSNFENFDREGFERYCNNTLYVHPRTCEYGYGFFLAGTKKDFEHVGGFDMKTFNPIFCEDDDFMVRLRMSGHHAYVATHALAYHFVSQTARDVAGDPMAMREFEANRSFGRKWGIEARYLWVTGYESEEKPLEISNRKILMRFQPDCPADLIHIVEPLVDYVQYSVTQTGKNVIAEQGQEKILEYKDTVDADIEIIQVGRIEGSDIQKLFQTICGLRMCCDRDFKEGSYTNGDSVRICIKKGRCDSRRVDMENYLSLQKKIEYYE